MSPPTRVGAAARGAGLPPLAELLAPHQCGAVRVAGQRGNACATAQLPPAGRGAAQAVPPLPRLPPNKPHQRSPAGALCPAARLVAPRGRDQSHLHVCDGHGRRRAHRLAKHVRGAGRLLPPAWAGGRRLLAPPSGRRLPVPLPSPGARPLADAARCLTPGTRTWATTAPPCFIPTARSRPRCSRSAASPTAETPSALVRCWCCCAATAAALLALLPVLSCSAPPLGPAARLQALPLTAGPSVPTRRHRLCVQARC